MKEDILGFPVDALSPDACVAAVFESLEHKSGKARLACLNPHSYAVALNDTDFERALKCRLADSRWRGGGVGVALLGASIPERVTGSDIFYGLHQRMNAHRGTACFSWAPAKRRWP
jgi:N-acetylglucosaminyldiphosphoundecaprenol N-acetyl-beta-D-mannosaminyltransferase